MDNRALAIGEVIEVVKPILKPHDWGGPEVLQARMGEQPAPYAPVIGFAIDQGSSIRFLNRDEASGGVFEQDLLSRAIANLETTLAGIQWQEIDTSGRRMAVFSGDFYCAEGILSPAIMRKAHELFDSELLIAACPERGTLFAMAFDADDASGEMEAITKGLGSMAAEMYFGTAQAPISPCVWLLKNGDVLGARSLDEKALKELEKSARADTENGVDTLNIKAGWVEPESGGGEKKQFHCFLDYNEKSKPFIEHFQHVIKDLLYEHVRPVASDVDNVVVVVVNVAQELYQKAMHDMSGQVDLLNQQFADIYEWAKQAGVRLELQVRTRAEGVTEDAARIIATAPFLIFYLVCAADGTIDKKEVQTFQGQCAVLLKVISQFAGEEVHKAFVENLQNLQAVLTEVVGRFSSASDALTALVEIRLAIDNHHEPDSAMMLKRMLLAMGTQLASASGGFFGFGSKISKEEKAVLALIAVALGVSEEQA